MALGDSCYKYKPCGFELLLLPVTPGHVTFSYPCYLPPAQRCNFVNHVYAETCLLKSAGLLKTVDLLKTVGLLKTASLLKTAKLVVVFDV